MMLDDCKSSCPIFIVSRNIAALQRRCLLYEYVVYQYSSGSVITHLASNVTELSREICA